MIQALSARRTSAARLHWQMRMLPIRPLAEAVHGPLLILAPHPDDETLGCGGLIATACAAGMPVHVLVLTDGTGSHPNSRTYPARRLRQIREAESREAARHLGLEPACVSFLGLPDRRAPQRGPEAQRAARAIAEHARSVGARTLFTTWQHDPHCDHLAASLLGRMAAELTGAVLMEYPVWGWTLPARRLLSSEPPDGFRLDITAHVAAKRRAILCHRSQLGEVIKDDPTGFTMDPDFIALFGTPNETFLRVR